MEIDQILQILQAVSDSEVEKFALEEGNLKLQIRKADKRTAARGRMFGGTAESRKKRAEGNRGADQSAAGGNLLYCALSGGRELRTGGRSCGERSDAGNYRSNEADE